MADDGVTEARARQAAKRVGLVACKWRSRFLHLNNRGGFMLFDPYRNPIAAGEHFELTDRPR